MKNNQFDPRAIELLPFEQNHLPYQRVSSDCLNSDGMAAQADSPAACHPRWKRPLYTLLVVLTCAPIFILAGLSPTLSHKVAYNGCMGNGDFKLPFTSSIWDPKHFVSTLSDQTHRFLMKTGFHTATATGLSQSFGRILMLKEAAANKISQSIICAHATMSKLLRSLRVSTVAHILLSCAYTG